MAVWMAMAGRSVVDKVLAIVFPITAFVAAGFEHSIANMYFMQLALIIQYAEPATAINALGAASSPLTVSGMLGNLGPVILGNLVGGSVFVGLVYHLIYRVAAAVQPATTPLIEKN
jgi:formate/nitrite transporter FocA (FNT family)